MMGSALACPPWAGMLKLIDRKYKNYKINLWRDHIDCKAKIFCEIPGTATLIKNRTER